ncbi:helix-turn-helix domain-containing protein [Nonomuraea sp. NPDC050556]|uniref:AraC-like ligand-binding domain-containing protein n=1 Tax=Nonomuraea sp. NPDC050556 TaxID=3364369 RepID=UPI0037B3D044
MATVIDSSVVAPAERAEAIRDVIWRQVVRVEIEHHPVKERISAVGAITQLGALNICSVRSNATTVSRTRPLVRDDLEPSVFVSLQLSGSSMVVQGAREAVLNPGDLALYDTRIPYTLVNPTGIHQHFFRIPCGELALPQKAIEQITAVRLGSEDPVAGLAATYFTRLADSQRQLGREERLAQPSIDLLRAVITSRLGDDRLAAEPLQTTLERRIMEYLRAHLSDHDLSPARIAHAHHISIRQLYAVMARADISLATWVRTQRLEECRKALTRPGARHLTIEAVARRWGFTNATHFSRLFKQAYGVTPREYRESSSRSGR